MVTVCKVQVLELAKARWALPHGHGTPNMLAKLAMMKGCSVDVWGICAPLRSVNLRICESVNLRICESVNLRICESVNL